MKEIPYWMPEFEKLLLKVASNPSSLIWIDELHTFYKQYEGKGEYVRVRFECESLMSMIYKHTGFFEQSFDIDLRLLKENPPETASYWGVISRAVATSDNLGRKIEIIPYAEAFLNTQDDSFAQKHVVLLWYVLIFAQKENSYFESFNPIVKNVELFLEEKGEIQLSFAERVKYLNDKYVNALITSNSFELAYSKANKEERAQLAKDYLATKPPKFFRERLKLYV